MGSLGEKSDDSGPFFICDPERLCDGCTCCKSPETAPSVSVGDYLRLAERTGEPIERLWRTKGDVSLTAHSGMPRGHYLVTLGLLHDPCPYLQDSRCSVHSLRPLGCASFPGILLEHHPEQLTTNYKDYRCLKDVRLRPEQEQLVRELADIMREEAFADISHLWGQPLYIDLSTAGAYFDLAAKAAQEQLHRDPSGGSPRSSRLSSKVKEMDRLIKSREIRNGIRTDTYIGLSQPVIYSLLEDRVASRLRDLSDEAKAAYRSTTERWKSLATRIE